MSATPISPAEWQKSDVVMVESDAGSNLDAIDEITEWARQNGFVRVGEYHLRVVQRPDGSRVFHGICYRDKANGLSMSA